MKLDQLHRNTILERTNRKAAFQAQLRRLDKTGEELADDVGVHKSTISRYKKGGSNKNGGRQPSLDTLRSLSKQGLDVVDLFGIKTDSDVKPRTKSVQKSKGGGATSRVSAKMLQASRDAQNSNRLSEPLSRP